MRTAEIKRKTKETDIELRLTLEGGERRIDTGITYFCIVPAPPHRFQTRSESDSAP